MAVTLVATVGASTANSYATVAEADTYFLAHPLYKIWDALYTTDKVRWLLMAAREIDTLTIDGAKYDTSTTSGVPDQALRFPRAQDYDGGTFIPDGVKDAQCEQAIHRAQIGTTDTRLTLQAQGVVEVEFDDVREKYGEAQGGSSRTVAQRAYDILNSFGYIKYGGLA